MSDLNTIKLAQQSLTYLNEAAFLLYIGCYSMLEQLLHSDRSDFVVPARSCSEKEIINSMQREHTVLILLVGD